MEKPDLAVLLCASLSPLCQWRLLTPQSPHQTQLSIPEAPGGLARGPGYTSSLGYSCGFQLLEAAVVASSKHGMDQQSTNRGAIYSRVALGPGAGPRAWGGSSSPHQGPEKQRRMKCWVSAFL